MKPQTRCLYNSLTHQGSRPPARITSHRFTGRALPVPSRPRCMSIIHPFTFAFSLESSRHSPRSLFASRTFARRVLCTAPSSDLFSTINLFRAPGLGFPHTSTPALHHPAFLISSSTPVTFRLPFHRSPLTISYQRSSLVDWTDTHSLLHLNTHPEINIDAPREIVNIDLTGYERRLTRSILAPVRRVLDASCRLMPPRVRTPIGSP